MKHRMLVAARDELQEVIRYYNQQRRGLGRRFRSEVIAAIQRILDAPENSPLAFEEFGSEFQVRRQQTKGFPYSLFYVVQNNEVVILAVKHASRATGYWKNRLADI